MFKILVTDAAYKHAIALVRYAKRDIRDLYVIGHSTRLGRFAKWHSCFDSVVSRIPLEQALETLEYDMVIPVGAQSVLTVAARRPAMAVLPGLDQLAVCFDKRRTIELARRESVPAPRTWYVDQIDQLRDITVPFPCVVKPAREGTSYKAVTYCDRASEVSGAVAHQLARLKGEAGVLVQEAIGGTGCGFFALMNHGKPLRIFMHQRIRESPPSGGRSTAARAFYSDRLKELGLKLLSSLEWTGVAMVEFKQRGPDDFVLMEINGKFWGSLELALSAGVNFGADLVRLFRGEDLSYTEDYDRSHEFYWPLDGDLVTLWKTRAFGNLFDYWRPNAHTNVLQNWRADALKSLQLAKEVVVG
jgi:predicted ATP-grasp superfamily ATP-dependent carboligase